MLEYEIETTKIYALTETNQKMLIEKEYNNKLYKKGENYD